MLELISTWWTTAAYWTAIVALSFQWIRYLGKWHDADCKADMLTRHKSRLELKIKHLNDEIKKLKNATTVH